MKKKHVLFIANNSNSGGAPRSMITMIKILKDKYNIIPIVITPLEQGIISNFCKDNDIKCYVIPYPSCALVIGNNKLKNLVRCCFLPYYKLKTFIKNYYALKKIKPILSKYEIDVIHTNLNRVLLGCMISKKYKIPHILHIREFGKDDYNLLWFKKNIFSYLNKYCSAFIAISNSVKKFWEDNGLDSEKIKVIYNGVDSDNIITEKTDFPSYNKGIHAIFSGSVIPSKGQFQVLKVIKLLPLEIRNKFHVDFYGPINNKYFRVLDKYIKEERIEENVNFYGHVDNLDSKLKDYNLAFMCSKSEGFGRVTIEYMLHNIPVIVSNRGANLEIIKHNKNGFIYEYENINDLKDKILDVIECKNLNKILETAKRDAVNKYSGENNAKEVHRLYEKIFINNNIRE